MKYREVTQLEYSNLLRLLSVQFSNTSDFPLVRDMADNIVWLFDWAVEKENSNESPI